MRILHAHFTCSFYMSFHMLILHAHFTCSFYMIILHAHFTCHFTCSFYMHILLIKLLYFQHWLVDDQIKIEL